MSDELDVPLIARFASITQLLAAMVVGTAALQLLMVAHQDALAIAAEVLQVGAAVALLLCGANGFHGSLRASVAGTVVGVGAGLALLVWALFATCNGFLSPLTYLASLSTLAVGVLSASAIPGTRRLDRARAAAA